MSQTQKDSRLLPRLAVCRGEHDAQVTERRPASMSTGPEEAPQQEGEVGTRLARPGDHYSQSNAADGVKRHWTEVTRRG
jgi:hypothetical protein